MRRARWIGLIVLALAALAVVAIPVWVIHPFRAQERSGLELSYALRKWAPLVTLVAAVVVSGLAVMLWRGSRWAARTGLALATLLTLFCAFFARQNHFEWMFAPMRAPSYVAASQVDFLNDDDMVLAVVIGGEAVAYPVRQLAYNHVLMDAVGGKPIVATY
jgi:hypothetical protein